MMDRNNKKKKVGLIIDNLGSNLWINEIISEIDESGFASCNVVITSICGKGNTTTPFRTLLYDFYCKLDESRWAATSEESVKRAINNKKIIAVNLTNPQKEEQQEILDLGLDILINLTDKEIPNELKKISRAGVWTLQYFFGRKKVNLSQLDFWITYLQPQTIDCILHSTHGEKGDPCILDIYTFSPCEFNSIYLNRIRYQRIGILILIHNLKQFSKNNLVPRIFKKPSYLSEICVTGPRFHTPGNMRMFHFLMKSVEKSLKGRISNKLFSEQWSMFYKLDNGLSLDYKEFSRLPCPRNGLWADPFIVFHEDTYYLFFEDALYNHDNANISVMAISKDGRIENSRPCLIRPYHLSYPFVFQWQDDFYMIPETRENNTIEIYKANKFPYHWEFHSILMDEVEAVDTTLFYHKGKWWMFTSLKQKEWVSINNQVSIFYADSPLSQNWKPHPLNPVVVDITRARSAGKIFKYDGKLIRPSQDCSVRYGYGLRLNEIVTLTESEYEEQSIDLIRPDWKRGLLGTHTLNHVNNLTVIDVIECRSRFPLPGITNVIA